MRRDWIRVNEKTLLNLRNVLRVTWIDDFYKVQDKTTYYLLFTLLDDEEIQSYHFHNREECQHFLNTIFDVKQDI